MGNCVRAGRQGGGLLQHTSTMHSRMSGAVGGLAGKGGPRPLAASTARAASDACMRSTCGSHWHAAAARLAVRRLVTGFGLPPQPAQLAAPAAVQRNVPDRTGAPAHITQRRERTYDGHAASGDLGGRTAQREADLGPC